jgi:hypothetical protein
VSMARVRVWRTWGPASCPFLIRATSSISPVSSVHAVCVRETGGQDHLDALRGRGEFSHVNLIETAAWGAKKQHLTGSHRLHEF